MMFTIPLQIALTIFCGDNESPAAKRLKSTTALSSQKRVTCLAFGPKGETVLAACWTRVGLWDATTGRHLQWISHTFPNPYVSLSDLALPPDGKHFAVAGNDGRITFWNLATGVQTRTILEPWFLDQNLRHGQRIENEEDLYLRLFSEIPFTSVGFSTMSLSHDGKLLAAGLKDGTIHVWATQTGNHVCEVGSSLARKREYQLDDILGDGQRRQQWRRVLGKTNPAGDGQTAVNSIVLWTLPAAKQRSANSVAFEPRNGNLIASDGTGIHVWNMKTKQKAFVIKDCGAFAVSPDGKVLVALNSVDGKTNVLNARTGSLIRTLTESRKANGMMMFSQDGKLLASAGKDQRVRVWNMPNGTLFREFTSQTPLDSLRALAISPDGRTLAAHWQDSGGIRVWNLADGKERSFNGTK